MVGYNKEKGTYFCEICKLNYTSKKLAEKCQYASRIYIFRDSGTVFLSFSYTTLFNSTVFD